MTIELKCFECSARYPAHEVRCHCDCGELLEVHHEFETAPRGGWIECFDQRRASNRAEDRSGVWRFRELIHPGPFDRVVTRWEGNTRLHHSEGLDRFVGLEGLWLKHEGDNPTGSFKDRGMTVGVTMAKQLGFSRVACASTGNTSASLASYAALAGLEALVFIPDGEIAFGKLAQALAFGARTIQIAGDFDRAMDLAREVCATEGIYLLNSINPFRIEGQKSLAFELLQDLDWRTPDWIVLPGGNLGNSSALYKGLADLLALGLIDRLPRLAVVQASGANPLHSAFVSGGELVPVARAKTIASAIRIGSPLSWKKSLRGVLETDGAVTEVTDAEIMEAKARVDRAGIGAEPASCATVAGIKRLVAEGVMAPGEQVVGVLTGHLLKDSDVVLGYHEGRLPGIESTLANRPERVEATVSAVIAALES